MFARLLPTIILSVLLLACSSNKDSSRDELLGRKVTAILQSETMETKAKNDSLQKLVNSLHADSIRNNFLFKIAYHYYQVNDSLLFRNWQKKSMDQSLKLRDTARIAESYWDLANFHYLNKRLDSAYQNYLKSAELYRSIGHLEHAGRMLYNTAVIQQEISDFTGSEIVLSEVLELFRSTKKPVRLYRVYNSYGVLYNELGEYEKALDHHLKAMAYLENIQSSGMLRASSLNNIGVVYQNQKNYKAAIQNYEEALNIDSIMLKEPDLYAMLLDNTAYSKFKLGDTLNLLPIFAEALNIRDSIRHFNGIIMSKTHLAEYYSARLDSGKAIRLLKEANTLAKETGSKKDILSSYQKLAELDHSNNQEYLRRYISLNEDVQQQERATRNKFAKIKFETDHIVGENQKLHGQRNVLIGLSLGIALLGFSGFVIKNQRTKNRELVLKQEQQEASEKIFRLLLDQQNMKEEGRQKERERLSEELHDGVLAKLFGLRLSLTSLNEQTDETSILQREKYLHDLQELGREIRQLSHELNSPLFTGGVGYLAIMEEVLSQQQENKFSYVLQVDEEIHWDSIPGNIKLHLLRILQEAVKNIKSHSGANHVLVAFNYRENLLVFTVQDNGKGFEASKYTEGIGLKNMESRTQSMKGKFKIETNINKGTKILVQIPV